MNDVSIVMLHALISLAVDVGNVGVTVGNLRRKAVTMTIHTPTHCE